MALLSGERLDDLRRAGLRIVQSSDAFCFSIDAVLLAHFATIKTGDVIIDLGTGSGVIPLLMSTRGERLRITGLELNAIVADRARRSIEINQLTHCISIVQGDLKEAAKIFGHECFTLVVSNPPYLPIGIGEISQSSTRCMARHEVTATLHDVVKASADLLSTGGRLALVHRPSRMADIFCALREYRLEPKRLRLVHPAAGKEANMVLLEAIKNAKPDLRVGKPIYIHEADGSYTTQIVSLYAGGELD
ncbi:MAG: type 11 methyltransferase [Bacillota bacterium]|nr:MAG: type 11 methyltransferase [Bacillota bacterium]MBS3950972.1 tRNA1(Val) (adenine(37)-N6)-methyltransferase [Peptococcaceae bacterium]